MTYTREQIEGNAAYFRMRLQAVKQKADAAHWAKGEGSHDFVLVDVRGRDAFAKAHVQGSVCVPLGEMESLAPRLSKEREIVTFCWSHL